MSIEFSSIVAGGLGIIFLIVLLGPFLIKKIEHNLEVFLFSMGILAVTVNSLFLKVSSEAGASAEEALPLWSFHLIEKALVDPIEISLAVLFAGLIFHYGREHIRTLMEKILTKIPLKIVVFTVIVLLGLLSSVITAIIAALLLVEIVSALRLDRKAMVNLTIVACFAIGLGAVLTPIGEPLSTIVIQTKMNESFFYLFDLLGIYIIPGVLAFGIIGVFFASRKETKAPSSNIAATDDSHESINDVLIRAWKV